MYLPPLFCQLTLCVFLLVACGPSSTEPTANDAGLDVSVVTEDVPSAWKVGRHPSCVAIDDDRVYVALIGPEYRPGEKNGQGSVVVYNANGQLVDTLAERIDSPLGLAVVGDVLYVTSVDRVYGFHKITGKPSSEYLVSEPHSLLGALTAAKGEDRLFVADPSAGVLWTVPLASGRTPAKVNTVFGISDLAFDQSTGRLYASSYLAEGDSTAFLYEIDATTGKSTRLFESSSSLAAIASVGARLIFLTTGSAKGPAGVYAYDTASKQVSPLLEGPAYRGLGPFVTLGDGLALVPRIYGDELAIIRLP